MIWGSDAAPRQTVGGVPRGDSWACNRSGAKAPESWVPVVPVDLVALVVCRMAVEEAVVGDRRSSLFGTKNKARLELG